MPLFQQDSVARGHLTIWLEHTRGAGAPCLLVGGAGAISAFWSDAFCAALAGAGRRVIRYDHRDTGHSSFVDFARTPYDLLDLLDDALALLDHAGAPAAHFIGHSMGGFIAQLAAIHHPERVLSLTSVSSHAASPDLPPPPERTWEVMLANRPCGDIERDLAGYQDVWRYLNGDAPFDSSAAEAYTRELYARNPATLPATNHVAIQASMQDRSAQLRALALPALVVHGERDPLVPLEGGRATAEAIPGAKLAVIPDAGHMFFNAAVWSSLASELIAFVGRAGSERR